MSAMPVTPRMPAGTSAHRWGWSVNRVERKAMSAQPMPQPSRAAPVMRLSPPPAAGPRARTIGSRKPTISEAATRRKRRRDGARRAFGTCHGCLLQWGGFAATVALEDAGERVAGARTVHDGTAADDRTGPGTAVRELSDDREPTNAIRNSQTISNASPTNVNVLTVSE